MQKVIKILGLTVLLIGVSFALEISIDKAKFDPLKKLLNIPEELKASPDNEIFLLQCTGPIKREWRNILSQKGVEIYGYIPHYAFIVKISPSKIENLKSLEFVRWIGPYHPYYKITTEFEKLKKVENINRIYVKGKGFVEYADPLYIDQPDLKSIVVYCLPNAEMTQVALKLQKTGAQVKKVLGYPSNRIILWTSLDNLNSIAKIPEIYYIFPYYPKTFFNNTTKYVLQSYVLTVQQNNTPQTDMDTVVAGELPVWDQDIKGQGEIVTVFDTGVDYYSCWFWDPEGDPPGPNHIVIEDYTDEGGGDLLDDQGCGHGTHVSGTVAGDPLRGNATTIADYQGHAYMGRIYAQDIGYFDGWSCALNINNFYQSSVSSYNLGSRIHTNSWGYSGANGSYQYEAIDIDVFSFANQDFLYTVAAGNSGPSSGTVTPPSTAKNCISVGSTRRYSYDTNSETLSDWSSRGPTTDNRFKPDLTTPGGTATASGQPWHYFIVSAYPDTSWGPPMACWFAGMVGTSMATPAAAGCAALVRQYYVEGWYPTGQPDPGNAFNPSGALVKATLLLSTVDMTGVTGYPNFEEGWGRILLDSSLYFAGDARKLLVYDETSGISTNDTITYYIQVLSSTQSFKIVLTWHDTAAAANANPTLVNDLDLYVEDPSANTYWGNNFSGGQSQPGGSPDDINNVEVFKLNSPSTGVYTVRVIGRNVATGALQTFAITAAGDIQSWVKSSEKNKEKEKTGLLKAKSITKGPLEISYSIGSKGFVVLKIYDATGRLVKRIIEGNKTPGTYKIIWNLKDNNGNRVSSGKYFYRLFINGRPFAKSLLVIN